MIRPLTAVALAGFLALNDPLFSQQTTTPAAVQSENSAVSEPPRSPMLNTLMDGTAIKMRLSETLSSADAKMGQEVPFEVTEDVSIQGITVIAKGAPAIATVTEAESKRSMGRAGKLNVTIDSVRLSNGDKVQLRAVKDAKGGGHVGAMTAAMVATSIVFFPAAPLFLFMKGKDITIPKGTEITAFVQGDTHLDMAKFGGTPSSVAPSALSTATAMVAVMIKSNIADADIEVDGNFVGDTPAQLQLPPGDHMLRLTKDGFVPWEKKLHTTAGNVTVNAEMESQPTVYHTR